MFRATVHTFSIRALVLGGLMAIAMLASTAVPSLGSSNTWTPTGSITTARTGHTATLLANGEVLVAGGGNTTILPSAELYNQATGKWTATGSMTTARTDHTATLLANGEVLVAGGLCSGGFTYADNSAELYDPSTGTWKATGSMNAARANTAATWLTNGQVLIARGNGTSSGARSTELHNPSTGKWILTDSMNVYRPNLRATLLTNGDVLVFGGNGS